MTVMLWKRCWQRKENLGNKWCIQILMHCIAVFDGFGPLQTSLFRSYKLLYLVGRMSSAPLTQVEVYYSLVLHIKLLRGSSEWPSLDLYLTLLVTHSITRWKLTKMVYHTTAASVGQTQLRVVFTCQYIAHLDLYEHLLSSQMLCYATFTIAEMLQLVALIAQGNVSALILMIGLMMRLLN